MADTLGFREMPEHFQLPHFNTLPTTSSIFLSRAPSAILWRSVILAAELAGAIAHGGEVWTMASPMPVGVAGFSHGILNDRIIVAGGTTWEGNRKVFLDRAWQFDPAGGTWSDLGTLPRPYAFGEFSALHNRLILVGGTDGRTTRSDMLEIPCNGKATAVATLAHPLAYAGSTSCGGLIYLLGGTSDIRNLRQTKSTLQAFYPNSGDTEILPDFPGGPVIHAALVRLSDSLFVFPGGRVDPATGAVMNSRAAWRYRIDRRQWEPIAPYPFATRGLAACILDDRHVLLAGGHRMSADGTNGSTDTCLIYDVAANAYFLAPALPYSAMLIGLERFGERIYAFGGEDRPMHRATTVCTAFVQQLLAALAGDPHP